MDEKEIRLQVYLARCNLGSRRKCETLIDEGRVSVNGTFILKQGVKVKPGDQVAVNGRIVHPTHNHFYIALNKPKGYICTNNDPEERRLAIDLIKHQYPVRLFNVGRLDFNSSGLIFFTNDGEFAKIVSHPSSEIQKEYIVVTKQDISDEVMDSFKKGVYHRGDKLSIQDWKRVAGNEVRIILRMGKNRELRRLFESARITVKKIHRIRIGCVKLNKLGNGESRTLSADEVQWFKRIAGTSPDKRAH